MSRVRADKLVNRAGSGAPELTYGAQVLMEWVLLVQVESTSPVLQLPIVAVETLVGLTGNFAGNAED